MAFDLHDWLVLGGMLLISFLISIVSAIVRRRNKSEGEFLLGSRKMPLLPTAVSLMASFLSSILILGYPADTFQRGPHFLLFVVGEVIGGLLALFFVVPFFYGQRLTSIYEYMELRFESRALRVFASLIGICYQLIYVGVCIYGPCTVFSFYTGFDTWKAILILGAIGTVPTAIGGLRGVIWMDFFQALVMYGMMIAILVMGFLEIGSWDKAMDTFLDQHSPISFDNNPLTTYTIYSAIIGGISTWAGHFAFSQSSVQRYSALPSSNLAFISVALGNLITLIGFFIACLTGIVIYSFYVEEGCSPHSSPEVKNPNQIMALFLKRILDYPAIPGLFVASLVAGGFSSITSSLTSIAANSWSDFISCCIGERSDTVKTLVLRIVVLLSGVAGTAIAYAIIGAGGTVIRLISAFINALGGPMTGLFFLGGIFTFTEKIGAFIGFLIGLAFNLWLAIGSYIHVVPPKTYPPGNFNSTVCFGLNVTSEPLTTTASTATEEVVLSDFYKISFLWYGLYGTAITVFIGLIVSLIVSRCHTQSISPHLLFSFFGYRCRLPPKRGRHKPDASDTFGESNHAFAEQDTMELADHKL